MALNELFRSLRVIVADEPFALVAGALVAGAELEEVELPELQAAMRSATLTPAAAAPAFFREDTYVPRFNLPRGGLAGAWPSAEVFSTSWSWVPVSFAEA
jgi:hypothetical protein